MYAEQEELDLAEEPLAAPRSLVDTRLVTPVSATLAHPGTTRLPVESGPFFLHGRDYPSVWCLWWLIRWAAEGPLELNQYLGQTTELAWLFASSLQRFDRAGELRVTTMFPTSTRNPDSASQTFQASAIGGLARRRNGERFAVGALPLWGVARIYELGGTVLIAPTQIGLDLLTSLEGISLELPHSASQSETFIRHLQEHALDDFADFQTVLTLVSEEPTRRALVASAGKASLGGSETLADVYAQAYVSRGREWGLIEPKLVGGRYQLTERGRSLLRNPA